MTDWSPDERRVLDSMASPGSIQDFLDSTGYSAEPFYRSPRSVLRDRKANCVDGALFAAMALRRIGHRPLVLEMVAHRDDDHLVAVFHRDGHLGSVAKSNFVGLRYREPIHRSIRELMLSYFEPYYNLEGHKALRSYSRTLDLSAFDDLAWEDRDEAVETIVARLEASRHYTLLSPPMIANLRKVDERSFQAGMMGAVDAGLYKPWEH
jgi:hypothetical protein